MILPGSLMAATAMRAGLTISPCPRAVLPTIARSTHIAAAAPTTLIAWPSLSLHRLPILPADRLRWLQRRYLSARVGTGRQPSARAIERHREHVAVSPRRAHPDFRGALGEFRQHG